MVVARLRGCRRPGAGRPTASSASVPSSMPPRGRPAAGLADLEDRLPGERDDDAGGDLEVDGLVAEPGDRAVQPAGGHDRRADGQGLLQGLRLGLHPLALPGRQHEQHARRTGRAG